MRDSFMRAAFFAVLLTLVPIQTFGAPGPNIVILTASFGAGHDKAAEKLQSLLRTKDPTAIVEVKNVQEFMFPVVRNTTLNWFNWAQGEAPGLYDRAFEAAMKLGRRINAIGDMPTSKMFRYKQVLQWLQAKNPDVIVSTFPHIVEVLDQFRSNGHFNDTPIGWVHTDNVSAGAGALGYFEREALAVDMAFLPSEAVFKDFQKSGVPVSRMMATGMPLTLTPRPPLTAEQRLTRQRAARVSLGLVADQRTIMIEAGRNGVGNYPLMLGSIVKQANGAPVTVITATGENKRQLEQMEWLANGVGGDRAKEKVLFKRMRPLLKEGVPEAQIRQWIRKGMTAQGVTLKPLGFTPLGEWRLAADIVATKPGGLSTAEMAAEGVPMILRSSMASGQELYNVRNFVAAGLAQENRDEAKIGVQAFEMADDRAYLTDLFANSEKFRAGNKTEEIADWVLTHAALKRDGQFPVRARSGYRSGPLNCLLTKLIRVVAPKPLAIAQ